MHSLNLLREQTEFMENVWKNQISGFNLADNNLCRLKIGDF